MLAQPRRVLLQTLLLELLGKTTFDLDLGPVVEVSGLGALEPHVLTALLLGHNALASTIETRDEDLAHQPSGANRSGAVPDGTIPASGRQGKRTH